MFFAYFKVFTKICVLIVNKWYKVDNKNICLSHVFLHFLVQQGMASRTPNNHSSSDMKKLNRFSERLQRRTNK